MIKLIKQLYPTGRAFAMFQGSNLENVHNSLNETFESAYDDLLGLYDILLPDNDNFTEADAAVWEYRLGLSSTGTLEQRKANISRRLNHPGGVYGRMSLVYLQGELQAAGFNVYIHNNKFEDGAGGYEVFDPSGGVESYTEHADETEHGDAEFGRLGFSYDSVILNYDDKTKEPNDPAYTDEQLRATFFIGGPTWPNSTTIDASREKEFRKLVLTLKSQNMGAFLLIDYV